MFDFIFNVHNLDDDLEFGSGSGSGSGSGELVNCAKFSASSNGASISRMSCIDKHPFICKGPAGMGIPKALITLGVLLALAIKACRHKQNVHATQ